MDTFILTINGKNWTVEAASNTPLLWVLRDLIGLTGTKYGCGAGLCGACTVHLDGNPIRSCSISVSDVVGREIVTIEGISADGLTAIQQAWLEEQVTQCGYCQSGQIMSALSLLNNNPSPTVDEIKAHMNGNICRCGTYPRIVKAILKASKMEATQ